MAKLKTPSYTRKAIDNWRQQHNVKPKTVYFNPTKEQDKWLLEQIAKDDMSFGLRVRSLLYDFYEGDKND